MPVSHRWLAALLVLVAPALVAADAPDTPSFADVGLYSIRDGDRLGLIDRTGRVVLDKGRSLYIDAKGNAVWSKP